MRNNHLIFSAVVLGLIGGVAIVLGDETKMGAPVRPLPKVTLGTDMLMFGSSVGSFKILGSDETPASGKLSFSFNGSVLVSGLEGTTVTEGGVRKEYENKEFGKTAYFGKGKITITGKARSIQFFGRDVQGSFKGTGLMRLYGEFDKKLDTGWVMYAGGERGAWGTGGNIKVVPQQIYKQNTDNVKIKDS